MGRARRPWSRFWCGEQGGVAVEFAIIGTVFLLVVGGVLDFGHAWYMRQVVTNASREGARYGVTYQVNPSTGVRKPPSAFSPTIQNYVLDSYLSRTYLPANASPTVAVGGTGYSTGTKGDPVEVTVTAIKTWYFLSGLIPGFGSTRTLAATTVMQCE